MHRRTFLVYSIAAVALIAPGALARDSSAAAASQPLTLAPLAINMSAALEPDHVAPGPGVSAGSKDSDKPPKATYGHAKAEAFTIGGLYANDLRDSNDFNLHFAYSNFLDDELEFSVEVAAWYFNQPGDDAGGVSGSMVFRWHFWHAPDFDWTVFADAGIGLLGAFDNVPEGGTGFNFLPRAGGGITKRLGDSLDSPRLMLGVRWHHVSNGRILGDGHNPSRDSVGVYAAIVFPF